MGLPLNPVRLASAPRAPRLLALALFALAPWGAGAAPAAPEEATQPPVPVAPPASEESRHPELEDAKAYFSAPLHWDASDWTWVGVSVAAIGIAHHYDSQVRTHFVKTEGPNPSSSSYDLQDAVPTLAVLGATWLYAGLADSSSGHREAWNMLEASTFSGLTTIVLRAAIGRERPNQTDDANSWFSGSSSFPSLHSTSAFAVGTVLAESGNDDYRWLRRLLGYGLGIATSYERMKHNQHWLSDTVAGGALGIASARFVMDRHEGAASGFALLPVRGGAMLTYHLRLD